MTTEIFVVICCSKLIIIKKVKVVNISPRKIVQDNRKE